jgi:DNA polymerase-3 subunit gamma/tau
VAESYLVLARKWRPQRFEDLLGQGHVAKTLSNAIRSGRVAHAFLFAGVRGVGKTSAARILAKALTCRKGPTPEPCNQCDACIGVTAGNATDVQEIDGASNNSVEDIRRLRENVAYQPSSLRFKIYIIDEVHMLSGSAFNALLKTLEEPPPHVKFIFATTEAHKIPVTILSRCQRYEFRRIATRPIATRLEKILADEGIKLEPAAVRLVADEAAGSMRDALSLLDQVLAAYPQGGAAQEITWLLGVTPHTLIARAAAAIVDRDARAALDAVREADDGGFDLQQFARSLLRHLRDLLVLASCPDAAGLTELADGEEAAAREVVRRTTVPHLHRLFALGARLVDDLARSPLPRVHADVAVARMATADTVVPIADILARLERLPAGRESGSSAPPARPPAATGDSSVPPPSGGSASRPFRPATTAAAPARPAEVDDALRTTEPDDDSPLDDGPPPDAEEAQVPAVPAAEAEHDRDPDHDHGPEPDPEQQQEKWDAIVAEVGKTDKVLAGSLKNAVPQVVSAKLVRLAFGEDSTAAGMLRLPRKAEALAAALERVLGAKAKVEVDDSSSDAARAIAARAAAQQAADSKARQAVLDHPAVREAMKAFAGSRVAEVKMDAAAGAAKGAKQR